MARERQNNDEKDVCRNRRAFHQYEVMDRLECGLVLTGTEVKSLRDGHAALDDAYAKLEDGEIWLIGSDIPECSNLRGRLGLWFMRLPMLYSGMSLPISQTSPSSILA